MNLPRLHIIKFGGALLEEPFLTSQLQRFTNLNGPKILVHGGGDQANSWLKRLGITPQKIDGRRITDQKTWEVLLPVYSGLNISLTARLQHLSLPAIAMAGSGLSVIRATKRPRNPIDYGEVGDIQRVDISPIIETLLHGTCLVFGPITQSQAGELLNTNADTVASQLAVALTEKFDVSIQYISSIPGVMLDLSDPQSLINQLDLSTYQDYKKRGIIQGGMLVKLDNAFEVLQKGVNQVIIADQISHSQSQNGTQLQL